MAFSLPEPIQAAILYGAMIGLVVWALVAWQ